MKKDKLLTRAESLRRRGYSIKEIAKLLAISQSTSSIWVRNIALSRSAIKRLLGKVTAGQQKSAENRKQKTKDLLSKYYFEALNSLKDTDFTDNFLKISCSLIYWCEGGKCDNRMVQFTNSDPNLIAGFLALLRKSYCIDEKKFRASIHLHEYHNPSAQITFWSKLTKIPKGQFIKPYLKPHTAKRTRDNYHGCLQIRYYDADITRRIMMLAKAFFENYRSLI